MSQLISISRVGLPCLLLLILLITQQISTNTIHRENVFDPESLIFNDDQGKIFTQNDRSFYDSIDDEIRSNNRWPEIIHPNYIRARPAINLRSGFVQVVPYKKRTIPLSLQKAIYAHGIIGRRR